VCGSCSTSLLPPPRTAWGTCVSCSWARHCIKRILRTRPSTTISAKTNHLLSAGPEALFSAFGHSHSCDNNGVPAHLLGPV